MPFNRIYNNKKVLITGNTGFKGSWLSVWLTMLDADVYGFALDIPTRPSIFEVLNLEKKISHHWGDIRDNKGLNSYIQKIKPDFIFHLAAQAIVSLSFKEPFETITTNVIGTGAVLDAMRQITWDCTCVLITSDKVYENVEKSQGYRETDSLGGKDIYSGSKAASELIIRSFYHAFLKDKSNIRMGIARAGNVIGGGDWAQDRIVVDCIKAFADKTTVDIRSPKATRPWQHVLEPLSGYLSFGQLLTEGNAGKCEAFNFGPRTEATKTVYELTEDLAKRWGQDADKYINIKEERLFSEATLLQLNCEKSMSLLHWHSTLSYHQCINFIVDWYKAYYANIQEDMYKITEEQIDVYVSEASRQQLNWAE
ncbi:MAG: CDP-glucose 4,6-dehydratase [Tannerella sp.]|jgi:CDP-glucose 4,6-dehydratase|nr:CDP-glucose 4,6-dehydratase [Tannerella sp.]